MNPLVKLFSEMTSVKTLLLPEGVIDNQGMLSEKYSNVTELHIFMNEYDDAPDVQEKEL